MKAYWSITLFVTFVFCGSAPLDFAKAEENEIAQKYKGEFAVAKAIDLLIRSVRAKYTQNIVGKLKKEGTGASVEYARKKGYVPLPAQHIRAISFDALQRQIKEENEFFNFVLRSRWNLNSEQGLQTDFERKGWEYLAKQQAEALKAGIAIKKIHWKPFLRVESINGQKMLRYLSADTASAFSCITCHNKWEQKPKIKKLRKKQGVAEGKIFQMHELMGVLSINVNIHKK